MINIKAEDLLKKYIENKATAEEQVLIERWYENLESTEKSAFTVPMRTVQLFDIRKNLPGYPAKKVKLWRKIAVASILLFFCSIGLIFYLQPGWLFKQEIAVSYKKDIPAGGNKAILTLANGSTITLTDARNGTLAQQSGVQITKTANGQIIYDTRHLEGGTTAGPVTDRSLSGIEMMGRGELMNTLTTPRGGQYQVWLPDGSKVWLNAATKLSYPVSFNGCKERRVELSGEAYFEVAKDKRHPFHVKTINQDVEVLGTHFNVNSYTDEPTIKTTLLEGSVCVSTFPPLFQNRGTKTGVVLKPNQQSSVAEGKLKISEVNTTEIIAWKNGRFQFEDTDIREVLRQLARWYDVEIRYEGQTKSSKFTGELYRNMKASEVLEGLSYTGLKFRIEEKTIIVTNK